jgi:hypothetical protein
MGTTCDGYFYLTGLDILVGQSNENIRFNRGYELGIDTGLLPVDQPKTQGEAGRVSFV